MRGWVKSRSKVRVTSYCHSYSLAVLVAEDRSRLGAVRREFLAMIKPLYSSLYHRRRFYIPTTVRGSLEKVLRDAEMWLRQVQGMHR